MRNLKTKLSVSMILIAITIILVVFMLIDLYEEKYILSEVDDALLSEASYFDNYTVFSDAKQKDESVFDIGIILIDERDASVNSNVNHFIGSEYNMFKRIYLSGDMKENSILKVDDENSSYVSVLIKVEDKRIVNELKDVVNYYPESFEGDRALLVLYVDISAYSNIINRIKVAFLILLFLSILLSGFVGSYFGFKIENSQKKTRHFFQNASHELKTPLTSIRGYAEAIKKGTTDNDEALDVIIKQSDNMQKLIDEILTISKLDSNEYHFSKEDVDIISIIETSVEKYQGLEDKKHLDVELKLDENNCTIKGDELQLFKAINTIIDNAFKFADSKVNISTYASDGNINIDIYNDGKGISKSDLNHIFDRFYSGDKVSTGIGLAMAKEIVALSGGKVKAINIDGGVVFKVTFTLS